MSALLQAKPEPIRNALALEHPLTVLVANAGYLDVFAVASAEFGAAGALHHVYRAQAGQPVVGGVPPPAGIERFIALPGPAAEVEVTVRKDWLAYYADHAVGDIIDLLTEGVWSWSADCPHGPAPSNPVRLVPGETASAASGEFLACDYGLVALEIRSGSLRLFGARHAELRAGDVLFLTRHAWLEALEEASVAVSAYDSIESVKAAFKAYRTFQQALTLAVCAALPEVERGAAERLKRRVRTIQEGLDEGVLSMHRLLDPLAKAASAGIAESEAIFLAASRVAALQGIDLARVEQAPGGTESHVQALAEASRIRVRRVTLGGEWWKHDNGPLLAFRAEDETPVVLEPRRGRRYFATDPATNVATPVGSRFASGLKPFAFYLYRPFPRQPIHVWDLVRFGFEGQRRDLWTILLVAIAIGLLTTVVPIATAQVVDRVIPSAQASVLLQIGLVLLAAALVQTVFELSRGYFLLRVQNRMEHKIQAALWDRVLGLPIEFFRDYPVGDLTMRVNAINMVYRSFSVDTLGVILGGLFSLLNFVVLIQFSLPLALLALAIVLGAVGFVVLFFYLTMHSLHHVIASNRRIMALILQLVQGLAKLRTTASEARAFGLWAGEFAIYRGIRFTIGRLSNQQKLFFSGYQHFAVVLVFVTMGALLGKSAPAALTAGEFVGFFASFTVILIGVISVCESLIGMYLVVPMYKMAAPLLQTLPEAADDKTNPGTISGAIELSQVSFAYPDGDAVLGEVSFSVPAGSFTAIVGPSGSGKSTLLRLLLAFDQPGAGAILYDDKNLKDLDQRALRKQFGVVLQGSPLMAGDIFTNIVGVSGGNIDDAWAAAKLAGIEEDIRLMPMGMHTVIGEGMSTLSGGQRQRILLARALVGSPKILFLDEATSALDNESQAIVSTSLLRLKATRIVIAHRLSTIAEADQIVVLDQGSVVQQGTYDELIQDHTGLFFQLAKRQSSQEES